jgi:Calcineurin-like phosphoesterase
MRCAIQRSPAGIVLGAAVAAALSLGLHAQPTTPSFRFGIAGDFATGDKFKKTAALVRTQNPDFLLTLGDLSYGSDEKGWCNHWKVTEKYNNVLVIAGNHDTGESGGGNINNYVIHCPNPLKVPIVGTYGKQYFFDFPATNPFARFIMIVPGVKGKHLGNISGKYNQGTDGFKFTAAAIDEARAKNIKWVFVGMHKNYISTLEKENEISTDNGRTFMTMLLNKRVDIIFQGHEHGYERSKQLATNKTTCTVLPTDFFNKDCVVDSDDAFVKGAGTIIHVLGTGGRDLRDLWPSDAEFEYFAKADVDSHGFGQFTVTPQMVSYVFQKSAGDTGFKDSFTITEAGAPPSPAPRRGQ